MPNRNVLVCGEKTLTIEPRVMAVLCLLAEEPGSVVTRDTLIARIWGTNHGGDDSVNQAISVLRKALSHVNGPDEYIQTIPRRGYRLRGTIGPLTEMSAASSGSTGGISASKVKRMWPLFAAAIAFGTFVLFWWGGADSSDNSQPAPPPSIAVLPFGTISMEQSDELLAASVHDALLTSLQKMRSLRVISKTSASRYKDSSLRIPQIASELGVTWIVEGRLIREGENIRINATLIDGRTDSTVWAQQYKRPFDINGVFEIQATISRNIARELSSMLAPDGVVDRSAPTQNMAAYRSYLLGKHLVEERTSESLEDGVAKLSAAIELDPQFAEAYAELSMAYSLQSSYVNLTRIELMDIAMPLAQRSVELAPGLAEAHTALADLREVAGDIKGAEESYQQAIRLNPNYPRARQWYAIALMSEGRYIEALEEHRIARDLDPLSVIQTLNVAQDLFFLGRIEESLAEYQYALEVDPKFVGTYAHLANIYRQSLARHDLAAKWLIDAHAAAPNHTEYPSQLAAVYLELAQPELARDWVECALSLGSTQYWPNRAGLQVALHNSDNESIFHHASLINERQPQGLLALLALRDHFLAQGNVDATHSLFTRSFPDMMTEPPEVDKYNYPAALALAHFYRQSGELERADALLMAVRPFVEEHKRSLELGADLADIEYLAMTGQTDDAINTLEQAVNNNWRRNWWRLTKNPHLQSLAEDPRFTDILATLQQRVGALKVTAPKHAPLNCNDQS